MNGFDVSHFQGEIDWAKAVADFVFVKATEGTGLPDAQHGNNAAGARSRGIPLGHYHFADGDDPAAEAAYFLAHVGRKPGELLALDLEGRAAAGNSPEWALTWLTAVFKATRVRPLLYINVDTLHGHDWTSVVAGNFGLWLACPDQRTVSGSPWPTVAFRQVGETGRIGGTYPVDQDTFAGSKAQLLAYGKEVQVSEAEKTFQELETKVGISDAGFMHIYNTGLGSLVGLKDRSAAKVALRDTLLPMFAGKPYTIDQVLHLVTAYENTLTAR